jgi:DNA-binding XRE family transcriptional regulator
MTADEFKSWRQRVGLTQAAAAAKFGVTRVTIQNWESRDAPIPGPAAAACDIFEMRLNQENPDYGPVTLVYSNGPMFIDPYGPRSIPLLQQELYPTNLGALVRVFELWGTETFHNPMVLQKSGEVLWNVVQLQRMAGGGDFDAPLGAAEVLRVLIAEDGEIAVEEWSTPGGKTVTGLVMKDADGNNLTVSTPRGYRSGKVVVPVAMVNYLTRRQFLSNATNEKSFRVTAEGAAWVTAAPAKIPT